MLISTGWQSQLPGDVLSAMRCWQRWTVWVWEVLRLVQVKRTTRHERWKLASVEGFRKNILLTLLGLEFHSKLLEGKILTAMQCLVNWICMYLFKCETEPVCYTSCDWTPARCCMRLSAGSVFCCDSAVQALPTSQIIFKIQHTAITCGKWVSSRTLQTNAVLVL